MALALGHRRVQVRPHIPLSVAAACAIGLLAARSPTLAVTAFVAALILPAAMLRPKFVSHLLVITIFAEAVNVGGITVGRLIAPVALIATLSQLINVPKRLEGGRPIIFFVTMYWFWALASLAWTVSLSGSFVAFGSLAIALVYMATFAVTTRTVEEVRRLLWTLMASSVALGLWSIASYLAGTDRFQTGAGDPNFVAAFQALALPLILALASSSKDVRTRALLYTAAGIVAASIIATLSRGGLITLGAILIGLAVLPARELFLSRARKVAFFLVVAIGVALLLSLALPAIQLRFQAGIRQGNVVGSRGDLWLAAIHAIREHPVLGLGYGGFKATSFQLLATTPGVNLPFHLAFRLRPGEFVHDAYLGTLAELGPLGLLSFLGILVASARTLRRTAVRAGRAGEPFLRAVSNGLVLSLLGFSVASLFLSSETSRALWFVFGLSLALPSLVWEPRSEDGAIDVSSLNHGLRGHGRSPSLTPLRMGNADAP
jgi:O-antigen ligase